METVRILFALRLTLYNVVRVITNGYMYRFFLSMTSMISNPINILRTEYRVHNGVLRLRIMYSVYTGSSESGAR